MGSGPVTVAVVSPQPIVQHGLVGLLGRHPHRVTVVDYPNGTDPDVLLYDVLALVHEEALDLGELIRSLNGPILAVSRDLRPELVARAVGMGVHGFFSIGASEEELVAAVEAAARGESTSGHAARPGAQAGLTDREIEVLTLIAQGHTNQEIARSLYLSPNSIKTYVRTAYRKIGASSRSQAVSWAIRHGFPTTRADDTH